MKKILSVLLCLGLIGCATTGRQVNQDNVEKLQRGITTQEEVVKIFGPPSSMSFNQDGNVIFTYIGVQAKNSAWNYIPVISVVHSETRLTSRVLTVVFKDDVVEEYTFSSSKTPVKYGIIS